MALQHSVSCQIVVDSEAVMQGGAVEGMSLCVWTVKGWMNIAHVQSDIMTGNYFDLRVVTGQLRLRYTWHPTSPPAHTQDRDKKYFAHKM